MRKSSRETQTEFVDKIQSLDNQILVYIWPTLEFRFVNFTSSVHFWRQSKIKRQQIWQVCCCKNFFRSVFSKDCVPSFGIIFMKFGFITGYNKMKMLIQLPSAFLRPFKNILWDSPCRWYSILGSILDLNQLYRSIERSGRSYRHFFFAGYIFKTITMLHS